MKLDTVVGAAIMITLISSCNNNQDQKIQPDFLSANIDTSVKPGDDFFLYANGRWIKDNPIPPDESSWGIGQMVQEEIYKRLKTVNEKAIEENAVHGTISQKIADFWRSGMDTDAINKLQIQPLQNDLTEIKKINSVADIISITGSFHKKGIGALFGDYVAQDDKNSNVMAYHLSQGGLGMPNRDYYFNTDEKSVTVRNAYKKYLYKTFLELGNDSITAVKDEESVLALETKLAKASRKLAELRDPYRNYNKMNIAALYKLAANIDWNNYLQNIGIKKLDSVIVGQPEFYAELSNTLKTSGINDWKNYLQAHLIMSSASYLDSTTFDNLFEYRKTLSGASIPRPRWKRVLDVEENAMGEALGQLFVKEYFNEKAKQRYSDLVEAIREAYKDRIKALPWMSDSTKQKAIDKLNRVTKKVGYPDKWKDFSNMQIDHVPYIINIQHANEWKHNYNINKLGKPVDKTEWDMSPQTYNAYYNPSNNEIVLPAGIFAVPGMRDEDLDDAFVYGYAGASTIGHEITHGFDDQGRQYNAEGNLKGWWLPKDSIQFVQRAEKIIKEFNEFNPVDTLHVNGNATQGENIADLGGLILGIDAFKKTDSYKKNKKINGYTPLQRYFFGYAYGWLDQERKELLANQLKTDEHAPAKERVNGPVVNIPEFYEAFDIKPGDKMYRADSLRVSIW